MRRKHESVRSYLLGALSDELDSSGRLPSERELADRLGVSRPTVRRALEQMAAEGRVRRVHGSGTFINDPPPRDGAPPATARVLAARETVAAARQSWQLDVAPGEPLWHRDRLLLVDGAPMALESAFVVKASTPGLIDQPLDGALEDVLAERYGIVVAHTRHAVSATLLEAGQARLLGVPALSPALLVERVSSDASGRRIAFTESVNRGDRCTLEWIDQGGADSSSPNVRGGRPVRRSTVSVTFDA
jgi:GntR family transcriptional regulator